jgi:steroid delta-isomerase-like uncharacterized protein
MSTENNKSIVRSFFERAINQGDLDWLDQIIAPAFDAGAPGPTRHTPAATGPERARQMVRHYRQAFPDIQFTVEDMVAEGERVAVHVTFHGTQRGEFMGVPATGRRVSGSGAELAVLADGKIVAAGWQYHDEMELLRQMGALPGSGGASHGGRHEAE